MQQQPFNFLERSQSNLLWLSKHFMGPKLSKYFLANYDKKQHQHLINKLSQKFNGEIIEVDRHKNLSPEAFIQNYLNPGKPVVLENAAKDWECCKNWNLDFFEKKYGNEQTMVTEHGDMKTVTLKDAIIKIRNKTIKSARICNVIQNNQELVEQTPFDFFEKYWTRPSFKTSYQFFLGGQGAETPLHAGATNNFQVQVYGQKTWWLISPLFNPVIRPIVDRGPLFKSYLNPTPNEEKNFPEFKTIQRHRAIVKSGDVLFNPTFFWHHVCYDSDAISIGVRCLCPKTLLKNSPMMGLLLALSTNPSALKSFITIRRGKAMPFYH